tara:strand:- start:113 stop:1678 length:1566 start_codon:yes stop_codon:yes gene_type:complete
LRTFFEAKAAGAEPMPSSQGAAAAPPPLPPGALAAMPAAMPTAGTPTSPTLPPLSNLPKMASKEHTKFTFNGLVMPSSAQAPSSNGTGVSGGLSPAAVASAVASASTEAIASENLRLKAQAHTLNDKVAQLTAHLATTSESVMRGNKALVTERAQFHAQYSALSDKLKEAQAQLIEAEAAPAKAVKNEKLLTAKLLELQAENDRLAASADDSEVGKQLKDMKDKYTSLSSQHGLLLETHATLQADYEQQATILKAAQAETAAALARADALQVEAATADSLVDTLDARLAEARAPPETVPTDGCGCGSSSWESPPEPETEMEPEEDAEAQEEAGEAGEAEAPTGAIVETATNAEMAPSATCCPKTLRCEDLQRDADDAKSYAETCCGNDEAAEVAWERHAHLAAVARRAWSALETGNPETTTAVHLISDPLHVPLRAHEPVNLEEHIAPTSFARGAHYEGRPLMRCDQHHQCCETESEYQALTTQARTNSFIEAVSKDLKQSMDGSQTAYANSMKTGIAVRV